MRKRSLGGRLAPAAPPAMPVLVPAGAGGRTVALGGTRCLRIADGAGRVVTCDAGEVWVTRDGSCDDSLLKPGQEFFLGDDTPVLIRALKQRVVRVAAEARRGADWRRFARLGRWRLAPIGA